MKRRGLIAFVLTLGLVSWVCCDLTPRADRAPRAGRGFSDSRNMEPEPGEVGGGPLRYGRRHALVVGVGSYRDPFPNLANPGNDAAEVAAELRLRYGFEDVELLLDAKPAAPIPDGVRVADSVPLTRAVLTDHLRSLKGRVGQGDALLFYYAGHGMRLGPHGFLVPADADPGRPESLLDLAEVARDLRECDAHHTLMVLDCCYSGTALEPGGGVDAAVGTLEKRSLHAETRDNLSRVFNRRAFQVITAGAGTEGVGDQVRASREYAELAKDLPEFQGHSPFTAVFLQGLRGLTGRPDGKQLASDLGYYLTNTLVNDERIDASQAPRYGDLGGDGDFLFIPTHKVLNPRLVAPLYLLGTEYKEPRQSACRALLTYIKAQQLADDRLGLARAAVPHLTRLLRDSDERPREEAARVLAELAESYADQAPEFAQAVRPLAAVVGDAGQPAGVRREAATALGRLGKYADEPAVQALRGYVDGLDKAWRGEEAELAVQLNIPQIPPNELQLPEELQAKVAEIPLPPLPTKTASPSARVAYEDARRRRLALLSAETLKPFVERHLVQGRAFLKKAHELQRAWDLTRAQLTAAKALGFQGVGRPVGDGAFAEANPIYLFPGAPEWADAERLATDGSLPRFVWCSPVSRYLFSNKKIDLAFAPDGKTLALGVEAQPVRLWDVATGKQAAVSSDDAGPIRMAFAPDGKTLAVGNQDGTVRLWDVATDKQTTLRADDDSGMPIIGVAFAPDGKSLACVGLDGGVRMWDATVAKRTALLSDDTGKVFGVAFAPDGKTLLSVDRDGSVRQWDVATGKQTALRSGHTGVTSVAFSPDGKTLALGSWSGTRLWDPTSGKEPVLLSGHTGKVFGVVFAPDGKTVASAGDDGTVRLWDVNHVWPIAVLSGHAGDVYHPGNVLGVAFAPDGKTVASVGDDGTVRLWDATIIRRTALGAGDTDQAAGPLDLTVYLPWCKFTDFDLSWRLPDPDPNQGASFGYHFLPPGSHLSILRSGLPEAEINRQLLADFLHAGNLDAACLLLPRLPEGPDRDKWGRALADELRRAARLASGDKVFGLADRRLQQARALEPGNPDNEYLEAALCLLQAPPWTPDPAGARAAYDRALDCLERAVCEGFQDWRALQADTAFTPLQNDVQFRKLLDGLLPPEEWMRRASAARMTNNPAAAIALWGKALEKDPANVDAYGLRGCTLARMGQFGPALADVGKAVQLKPDAPNVYYNLACVYSIQAAARPATAEGDAARRQDLDRAMDALEQAVQKGYSNWQHVKADADLKALRDDPRYKKLMEGR